MYILDVSSSKDMDQELLEVNQEYRFSTNAVISFKFESISELSLFLDGVKDKTVIIDKDFLNSELATEVFPYEVISDLEMNLGAEVIILTPYMVQDIIKYYYGGVF